MRSLIVILVLLAYTSHTSNSFKLLHQLKKVEEKLSDHPKGFGTAKYAVIIGIDGFGGLYLKNVSHQYPSIQSFFDKGAHTTRARNVIPTVSGPNWATYLTSMEVNQHGVYDNGWVVADGNPAGETSRLPPTSGRGRPQTLFSIIKEHSQSLVTALLFTWDWFLQITKQNPHVDHSFWGHEGIVCGKNESYQDCLNRQDWNVQKMAVNIIKKFQPALTFIHFDSVDGAGHATYWGSDIYYEMVQEKELQVQGILEALENTTTESGKRMIEETIIVIVADHGGYRNNHDFTPPMICEVYVPLLIRGPGVKNVNLEDPLKYPDISTLDMAVTVLNALGIEKGKFMRGRVLEEIYEDD